MSALRFDHFISYTSAADIDDYLKEYAAQGFSPSDRTVRHEPGLRNGFLFFGPEYLEFAWVEDAQMFDKADAGEKLLQSVTRRFGIGLVADDVNAVHSNWVERGYSLPEVWSKSPRDAVPGAPAAWSFQEIPAELLPGASCFALTYHARPRKDTGSVRVPRNTIYGVAGVIFVAQNPEARATRWRDLLAPGESVVQTEGGFEVVIGPHRAEWMTPATYSSLLQLNWEPAPRSSGELSAISLFAKDRDVATRMLEGSGRRVVSTTIEGTDTLIVTPDERDGFAFTIQQHPIDTWIVQRTARTGENLIFSKE